MKKGKIIITLLIACLLIFGGGFFYLYSWSARAVDKNDTETMYIDMGEGYTTSDIAASLEEEGIIRSATSFKLRSRLKGYDGKYQAGMYEVSKSMTMDQIMTKMVEGETAGHTFQVQEGMTIDKVAVQFVEQGIVNEAEFYEEVETGTYEYDFIKELPEGPTRLEGFLFPNTYKVDIMDTEHEVIDAMLKGFDDAMRENGIYEAIEEKGMDLYEVITEASIVQREAGNVEEMATVASVINNRLEINMPLQMDSIIAYIQKEDKIRATYSDIAVESEYNPYTNYGLPPGPICAPGIDAIKAVLEPAETDYLYFVASPEMDGTNRYSVEYEDFLKDKEEFDAAYEKYIQEHPDEE